jgi:non-ribosomal peptide synthetase-like protein
MLSCPGRAQHLRWRPGERLPDLFEARCDEMARDGRPAALAVGTAQTSLTFGQLDARANQVARLLLARGARPGDRIALLFDRAVPSYVAMLATLKVHAAYVPVDPGYPRDRVDYILEDSRARFVLSLSHVRDRLGDLPTTVLCLDELEGEVATLPTHRVADAERGAPVDELAYIIYTSGTTGRPKGVAVEHASICNFVRVACEVYGIEAGDRVYQGMTLAFDFSVEEIWVPLLCGATLVPKPGDVALLGAELADFLRAERVTALCCVPTLLATLEDDLPELRFLLVSGEACPQHLVRRWHRAGRRFLNVYGPTEATVTATWSVVHPDRPVTLGVPLPTYTTVVLDPDRATVLPAGAVGEIGIAGPGLARGYVNRDDLTRKAFIDDFLGVPNNPTARIYRTGDLGRVTHDGEIEYHGRIDTQVKVRGYRIELGEIESTLLEQPGIAQAAVTTREPEPGVVDLVAYYTLRQDAPPVDISSLYERLRASLPPYMVPTYLEPLDRMPMLASDKVDRRSLPAPTGRRGAGRPAHHVAPASDTERALAEAMATVLGLDQVSTDSHFFDDLGASSLLMSHFCARVREHTDLPSLSMKDVYLHPTVRSLAAGLDTAAPAAPDVTDPRPRRTAAPPGTLAYVVTGALQLVLFLAYVEALAWALVLGDRWLAGGVGVAGIYLRALTLGCAAFLGLSVVPVLAKWLLVGRWRRREMPVWGPAYVRLWLVRTLLRVNPMVLFVGTPLYPLYLRALGAHIGRRVTILSRTPPVCTDLLEIGDDTVIRKDCSFTGYRAHDGVIQTGRVVLGRDVLVGEATVLDIDTAMGDGAALGHTSSLQSGQRVPDGQTWHGSPAVPTTAGYRTVPPIRCATWRRVLFPAAKAVMVLGVYVPAALVASFVLLPQVDLLRPLTRTDGGAVVALLVVSFVAYFGSLLVALAVGLAVPRLLRHLVTPGVVYPLYGARYSAQRTMERLSNSKTFMSLFGDSSAIVHYLRALGYDLSTVEQTGSNFGMAQKHATPFLTTVGSGTMVADGLSVVNADFSSTSFRLAHTSIGPRCFLGNNIVYPSQSRLGGNVLLGTKTMVPVDGPVRADTGLVGSPCFEIPRTVARDAAHEHLRTGVERQRRLRAKNRYNAVSMVLFLLVRWVHVLGLTALLVAALRLTSRFGPTAIAAFLVAALFGTIGWFVLVDRLATGFRRLHPRLCSIYDPYYWWHERYWKLSATPYLVALNGTPFKNVAWRLLGARVGRRVFDNGLGITERSLVTIGDECVFNEGSLLQGHSMEDGIFKSDRITVGDRCTLGPNAFCHYGTDVGSDALLRADSFLMKGSQVRPGTSWGGNPARELAVAPRGAAARGRHRPPRQHRRTQRIPSDRAQDGDGERAARG